MIETVFKEFIDTDRLVPEKAGLRQLISDIQRENQPLVQELNTSIQTVDSTRKLVEKLTLETIDESVIINTPFQTDFGRHIHFGKDIYINKDVFMVLWWTWVGFLSKIKY